MPSLDSIGALNEVVADPWHITDDPLVRTLEDLYCALRDLHSAVDGVMERERVFSDRSLDQA